MIAIAAEQKPNIVTPPLRPFAIRFPLQISIGGDLDISPTSDAMVSPNAAAIHAIETYKPTG